MAGGDGGVEFVGFAASDGVDEVAEVAARPGGEGQSLKALPGVVSLGIEPGALLDALDVASLGVELVVDVWRKGTLVALAAVQSADLEDDQRAAEVEDRQLQVGRLALVLEIGPFDPAAAHRDHAKRLRPLADRPAGDVHLVDALVADLAVAGVPKPVPLVMDQILVVRLRGGRAEPEVVVEPAGGS